jgi:glutamate N-acetyltransferase/amino-acid N-acetyltransferase
MCDEAFLSIWFDEVCVYKKGELLFDEKVEPFAAAVMQKPAFTIHCDIGLQDGEFTAYGCDLGHEYVKINADYRT